MGWQQWLVSPPFPSGGFLDCGGALVPHYHPVMGSWWWSFFNQKTSMWVAVTPSKGWLHGWKSPLQQWWSGGHHFKSDDSGWVQLGSEKEQASSVKVSLFHLTTRLQLLTIFTKSRILLTNLPTHQYSPVLATTPLPLLANSVSTSLISDFFLSNFSFYTSLFLSGFKEGPHTCQESHALLSLEAHWPVFVNSFFNF